MRNQSRKGLTALQMALETPDDDLANELVEMLKKAEDAQADLREKERQKVKDEAIEKRKIFVEKGLTDDDSSKHGKSITQAETPSWKLPDEYGNVPLMVSAEYGHTNALKRLLGLGCEASAARASGYTALHLAARAGHEETCRLLMQV